MGLFKQKINQSGFAVVNMSYYGNISDFVCNHYIFCLAARSPVVNEQGELYFGVSDFRIIQHKIYVFTV